MRVSCDLTLSHEIKRPRHNETTQTSSSWPGSWKSSGSLLELLLVWGPLSRKHSMLLLGPAVDDSLRGALYVHYSHKTAWLFPNYAFMLCRHIRHISSASPPSLYETLLCFWYSLIPRPEEVLGSSVYSLPTGHNYYLRLFTCTMLYCQGNVYILSYQRVQLQCSYSDMFTHKLYLLRVHEPEQLSVSCVVWFVQSALDKSLCV